jgi:hypothetical protein
VLHGLLARFGEGARMARVRVVRPGVSHGNVLLQYLGRLKSWES